jgi:hypothetical protein
MSLLAATPWDLAPHLPWSVLTSPAAKWAAQPSFLIGEYLFYACTALAFAHAWRQGPERRKHVLVWFAALLAGTANDIIFMALPLVDNFWQAQTTIMLTPRLPLYIPCVYVCFMYYATVSVWRLGLPPLARAALTGLCGSLFYAPYDITGVKFLWWTWHDSDLPIAQRILGAPIGSTMWVMLFVASFAWLINRVLDRDPAASRRTVIKGLGMVAAFSTLIFLVQITALQQLDGGVPGPRSLVATVALYGAIIAVGWRRARPLARRAADRILHGAAALYFSALFVILAVFDPTTHRSASMHQTYGPCHVEAKDIAGFTRYQYLCAEDFAEDFTFDCVDTLPAAGDEWYTVCGRAHTDRAAWLLGVGGLGVAGIAVYSFLLGAWRRRED